MSLSPAPLSLLIKAAPILTDDMYGDIQPAAWELLLSVDEHMAAAAGHIFIFILTVKSDRYHVLYFGHFCVLPLQLPCSSCVQ